MRTGHTFFKLVFMLWRDASCRFWTEKGFTATPFCFGVYRLCIMLEQTGIKASEISTVHAEAIDAPPSTPASSHSEHVEDLNKPSDVSPKQKRKSTPSTDNSASAQKKRRVLIESARDINLRRLETSFGAPFPLILKSDQRALSKDHRFLHQDNSFVTVHGCEFDAKAHKIKIFNGLFKNDEFWVHEDGNELVPLRHVVQQHCRQSTRTVMAMCYQVRPNVWAPLLLVAEAGFLRGTMLIEPVFLPSTENPDRQFVKSLEMECMPETER
eukprot:GILK01011205.1.p1 GENE.GILK01011205.1~~GILK01011205.1.p1  ORF type:complete len:269 (+),score=22.47 GILK01011205.1:169-975(+)